MLKGSESVAACAKDLVVFISVETAGDGMTWLIERNATIPEHETTKKNIEVKNGWETCCGATLTGKGHPQVQDFLMPSVSETAGGVIILRRKTTKSPPSFTVFETADGDKTNLIKRNRTSPSGVHVGKDDLGIRDLSNIASDVQAGKDDGGG